MEWLVWNISQSKFYITCKFIQANISTTRAESHKFIGWVRSFSNFALRKTDIFFPDVFGILPFTNNGSYVGLCEAHFPFFFYGDVVSNNFDPVWFYFNSQLLRKWLFIILDAGATEQNHFPVTGTSRPVLKIWTRRALRNDSYTTPPLFRRKYD